MTINNYNFSAEPPTFYETLRAVNDYGLVGEEDTVLTLVLALVRGHLVVMSGLSRSGKDIAVDAAESVFPADEMVHKWPADESETAAYYNRHEINRHPVHRFPDLARLPEHQERILKAFGEGRDADRIYTDVSQEEGDQVQEQTIECPNTVVAFIATDNENIDLNDYPELRNRALIVSVDSSEEQTRRVNRRKAQEHAGALTRDVEPMRVAEIQNYHGSIPTDEWINTGSNQIINPSAINIHEQQPIPEMFPEARQDFDRLLEFMETVTLYHYVNRMVVGRDSGKVMLTTPVDVWEAMTILGNKMVMSALNLRREDRAILELLQESKANLTKAEIQQSLRTHGLNITDSDVARSVDSMRTKGYVRVHQGNPNSYSLNEFASVTQHDAGLDYNEVVDAASEQIYDVVDEEHADEYVERFCTGDGLITTHPFTGEAVDIRESRELDEMMDSGIEGVEDIFDRTDVPTSDSDDDSDETETVTTTNNSGQQTLY